MPRSRWSIDQDSILYLATPLIYPVSLTITREPINPSHSFLDTETSPSKSNASMTGVHLQPWQLERLGSSPRAPSSPSKQPTTRITKLQKVLRLFFLSKLIADVCFRIYQSCPRPLLPIVKIRVACGDHDPIVFAIHKNILEHCSPFFKALFTSVPSGSADPKSGLGEERSAEQEITPTVEFEASAVAFRLYTEWVYSGLIPRRVLEIAELETETEDTKPYHRGGDPYRVQCLRCYTCKGLCLTGGEKQNG
jgi:hypothetical protein